MDHSPPGSSVHGISQACHFLLQGNLALHLGLILHFIFSIWTSQMAQCLKNLPAMQKTQEVRVQYQSQENPVEKDMATYSSILAWRIPWAEELGGLQSKGSQRVGHN